MCWNVKHNIFVNLFYIYFFKIVLLVNSHFSKLKYYRFILNYRDGAMLIWEKNQYLDIKLGSCVGKHVIYIYIFLRREWKVRKASHLKIHFKKFLLDFPCLSLREVVKWQENKYILDRQNVKRKFSSLFFHN